ncbi:MAG TPA: adenosylmethionine--8-amino-7-oxononanoate transaminase [Deltaproteobacteria bacterium]|nr:adenosylmethionine--8-amino-7-oxononanoate transaminase [Deltaproteobacteria bacterium]
MKPSQKKLKHIDKKYLWHPFTQMRDWENEDPLIIEKGKGNWLYDVDGKKYLDGISSLWVTVHGHRKKEIDQSIKKQIDKVSHSTLLGLSNVPAALLAEQLVKISPPNLKKVFYSDSGSTAVEIALKMAFQYWSHVGVPLGTPQTKGAASGAPTKIKFLTFQNAYHGDTIGSVSVGGIDLFHQIFKPLLFHSIQANFGNVETLICQHRDELAAVILEPMIQGAAGMLLQPKGFLKKLRKLCDDNNVILIFDEVATGFGRTGKMFACQHEGVWPDIMCMAKGITGGYLPLAATLTSQKIYDAFHGNYEELKTFFHGHTYTGNPLACAAALANLEIFKKEKTIQKTQSRIKQLKKGLEKFRELKHVGDIRQLGLMVGIELFKEVETKTSYQLTEKIGIRIIQHARKLGVIIRPLGPVIVLMPPLSITEKEMEFLLKVTFESIRVVTENGENPPFIPL